EALDYGFLFPKQFFYLIQGFAHPCFAPLGQEIFLRIHLLPTFCPAGALHFAQIKSHFFVIYITYFTTHSSPASRLRLWRDCAALVTLLTLLTSLPRHNFVFGGTALRLSLLSLLSLLSILSHEVH
ncbi:MAG: hypothetical protein ABIQ02_08035, partial [Saprospiraceae bacterium]